MRVLFIDDDAAMLAAWRRIFRDCPTATTAECHSVEEALRAVTRYQPQVVFLDHHLTEGGSEGLEIADQLIGITIYSTTSDGSVRREYEKRGIEAVGKTDLARLKSIVTS